MVNAVDVAAVWAALDEVHDPEIPALSVVDLGVIRRVWTHNEEIVVELMPTFLGCPALALMRDEIAERVGRLGSVRVKLVRDEAWTSDRISERGRERLRESGFAAPPRGALIELFEQSGTACPYCGSNETLLESAFGPTACRAIHYCRDCRQPFEQFKPV